MFFSQEMMLEVNAEGEIVGVKGERSFVSEKHLDSLVNENSYPTIFLYLKSHHVSAEQVMASFERQNKEIPSSLSQALASQDEKSFQRSGDPIRAFLSDPTNFFLPHPDVCCDVRGSKKEKSSDCDKDEKSQETEDKTQEKKGGALLKESKKQGPRDKQVDTRTTSVSSPLSFDFDCEEKKTAEPVPLPTSSPTPTPISVSSSTPSLQDLCLHDIHGSKIQIDPALYRRIFICLFSQDIFEIPVTLPSTKLTYSKAELDRWFGKFYEITDPYRNAVPFYERRGTYRYVDKNLESIMDCLYPLLKDPPDSNEFTDDMLRKLAKIVVPRWILSCEKGLVFSSFVEQLKLDVCKNWHLLSEEVAQSFRLLDWGPVCGKEKERNNSINLRQKVLIEVEDNLLFMTRCSWAVKYYGGRKYQFHALQDGPRLGFGARVTDTAGKLFDILRDGEIFIEETFEMAEDLLRQETSAFCRFVSGFFKGRHEDSNERYLKLLKIIEDGRKELEKLAHKGSGQREKKSEQKEEKYSDRGVCSSLFSFPRF